MSTLLVPFAPLRKEAAREPRFRTVVFSQRRVLKLLDGAEADLRRTFLELVRQIRSRRTLDELAALISAGRWEEAIAEAEVAAARLAARSGVHFLRAGEEAAGVLSAGLQVTVSFDQVNWRAVGLLQRSRFDLIREFSEQQRAAVREALAEGTRLGLNPREQARAFRDSIGLTERQVRAVNNYRRLLRESSGEALTRRLRDRRFDPAVRAAVRGERTLLSGEIDRMVSRYRERYLAYRAETIARNESLRAVHEGSKELVDQAAEQGIVDPAGTEGEWFPTPDNRTRDPHARMRGQRRPWGQPFVDGEGNLLMYPGDPSAPAKTTVQCRCTVGWRTRAAA